jgi:peptidoglycan/LPS O-acetylase OafA/YrhL
MEPWTLRAPLASRLSFLGDASYSIYLSHTFVVPAGVMALKRLGVQDSLAIVLAVSLAVVMVGCLSYVWLERPMTAFFKRVLFGAPKPPALSPKYRKATMRSESLRAPPPASVKAAISTLPARGHPWAAACSRWPTT